MARIRYNHNSFSIGVLSKRVQGNTEFEGYNNALDECVNFQIQQTGGLFKRGGTYFVAETKSGEAVLVLFSYSAEDQYICEFGEQYIRFYTKYGKLIKEDGTPVEVETPFSISDVKKMKTFQEGNVLNLVTNKGIYSLRRVATDEFQLSDAIIYTAEPLTFMNREKIALVPDKVSGTAASPITITAVNPRNISEKPNAKYAPLFYDSDVEHSLVLSYNIVNNQTGIIQTRRYYLTIVGIQNDTGGFKKIQAVVDPQLSDGEATQLPNTNAVTRWQIGAFTSARGMPQAASIYEGRLFLANNLSYPTGIWGSSKLYNDWTDFYAGTNDADAVSFKMNAQHADEILWLISQSKLFAGTRWGIYIGGSATYNDDAITPSNFRLRLFESIGASELQPISALDSIFFVDISGRNVHEIYLSAETGAYEASDLSLLSNDLTRSGIISHTWQQTPIKTYWCAVEDGYLCSLTYLKNNGILAWAKHVISGKSVKVENICTMRGENNDLVWMVVRREVNGEFKRYIEYLHPAYDPLQQEEFKQFYVDAGITKELKYKITDIQRGQNPRLRAEISKRGRGIIQKLHTLNNGEIKCKISGEAWNDSSIRLFKNIDRHYYTSGDRVNQGYFLADMFDVEGRKIKSSTIPTTAEAYTGASCFVKVATVFKQDGFRLYCDTQYLSNGDSVLIPTWRRNTPLVVAAKSADSFELRGPDNTIIIPINLPVNSEIFLQISSEISLTRTPEDCVITVDEALPEGYEDKVYINKVNGMTQINSQKFSIADLSEDRTQFTLIDDYTQTPVDASDYSPFDTVNPNGNVYLYFNTVEGLNHLAGQEVALCVDGNSISNMTVPTNGTLTLDRSCMYCSAGLPMKSWMKTTPFSGGSMVGSSVGSVGGQKSMWLHLYYSLGGKYGAEAAKIYDIPYTNFISGFNKTKSLISGLVKCPIITSHDVYDRSIYIEHSEPLSFNILSITQDIEVSDA